MAFSKHLYISKSICWPKQILCCVSSRCVGVLLTQAYTQPLIFSVVSHIFGHSFSQLFLKLSGKIFDGRTFIVFVCKSYILLYEYLVKELGIHEPSDYPTYKDISLTRNIFWRIISHSWLQWTLHRTTNRRTYFFWIGYLSLTKIP